MKNKDSNASSWRDKPEPDNLAVNRDALSPGKANKRPSIQLQRGQSIKNSVTKDSQARNYGPKASLLVDNFAYRDVLDPGPGHVNMMAVGSDGEDVPDA